MLSWLSLLFFPPSIHTGHVVAHNRLQCTQINFKKGNLSSSRKRKMKCQIDVNFFK